MPEVAAVVVAAGRGTRAGGDLPKQFRQIGGETLLRRSLAMFADHGAVGAVQPVINADDGDLFRASAREYRHPGAPSRRRDAPGLGPGRAGGVGGAASRTSC